MPRNGSGTYTVPSTYNPVQPNTVITSDWANVTLNDVAAAITQSISRDGQTTILADLPMSGYKHVGVGAPTSRTHYASVASVQDNQQARCVLSASGTADALIGAMSIGAPTAYANGMVIWFLPLADNTGSVTINVNGCGVKSVLSPLGGALAAGDLLTGQNYYAYYDASINGTGAFILLNEPSGSGRIQQQNIISGWLRPSTGTYPVITIAGDDVTVPAGTGMIVAPLEGVGDGTEFTPVSWDAQTITLTYGSSSSSTLLVDSAGVLSQAPGRPAASALRQSIVVGYAVHPDGVSPAVVTAPAIQGDNGYLFRDHLAAFENTLVSGGRLEGNGVNQQLVINGGYVLKAGAGNTDLTSPNLLEITGASPATVLHFNGTDDTNYAAGTTTLDVGNYDPNFLTNGALVALGAGEWAFMRVFFLFDRYVVVYGQYKYTAASAAAAMAYFPYDTGRFTVPVVLQDAAYLGAILVSSGAVGNPLDDGTNSLVISKGGVQFGIQSAFSVGFLDAPADGNTYGRNNNAWATTISSSNPVLTGSGRITGNNSLWSIRNSGTGDSGVEFEDSTGTVTADIVRNNTSGLVSFRGYNGVTLTSSWTWDPVNGDVNLNSGSTIDGDAIGNVIGPASCANLALAQWSGTTGKLLQDGPRIQAVYDDDTDDLMLKNGSWGLGTDEALVIPAGPSSTRPNAHEGELRYNTDTKTPEYNAGFGYVPIALCPPGFVSGLSITANAAAAPSDYYASSITVSPGVTNMLPQHSLTSRGVGTSSSITKTLSAFSLGDNGGGRSVAFTNDVPQRVFLIWKDDYTADVGFDTDANATNLLAAANALSSGFSYYRRIGWVYPTGGSYIWAYKSIGFDHSYPQPICDTAIARSFSTSAGLVSVTAFKGTVARLSVTTTVTSTAAALYGTVYAPDLSLATPVTPSATNCNIQTGRANGTDSYMTVELSVPLATTDRQVAAKWSAAPSGSWRVFTLGWHDDLSTP